MTALELATELAKRFEGLGDGDRKMPGLQPYRDPVGLWTIGYGHLLSPDPDAPYPTMTITAEQAEALLERDMLKAADWTLRLITAPLTDGQAAALFDFTFNLGPTALRSSTLRRIINRGELDQAPKQLMRWVYAGGAKLRGLVRRRAAEVELWTS